MSASQRGIRHNVQRLDFDLPCESPDRDKFHTKLGPRIGFGLVLWSVSDDLNVFSSTRWKIAVRHFSRWLNEARKMMWRDPANYLDGKRRLSPKCSPAPSAGDGFRAWIFGPPVAPLEGRIPEWRCSTRLGPGGRVRRCRSCVVVSSRRTLPVNRTIGVHGSVACPDGHSLAIGCASASSMEETVSMALSRAQAGRMAGESQEKR